jgi:hypothetical protein
MLAERRPGDATYSAVSLSAPTTTGLAEGYLAQKHRDALELMHHQLVD